MALVLEDMRGRKAETSLSIRLQNLLAGGISWKYGKAERQPASVSALL